VRSISILTVVYSEEVNFLALQARSIARFFRRDAIAEIIIIVNGTDQRDVARRVREEVLPEYGDLSKRVTIILADDIHRFRHPEAGWHTQMALKLLGAPLISSDWYLVLDAKNHFIRTITADHFFSESDRGLYPPDDFRSLREHFKNAAEFFRVEPEGLIDAFFSPITPSILHRQSALDMNDAVLAMTGDSIGELIVQFETPHTEFILYSLYLYSIGRFDDLYEPAPPITISLWKEHAVDAMTFDAHILRARSDEILCFSVHRLAREILTSQQRQQIARLWLDAGLIDDTSSADRFLSTEHQPK